ncbi:GrpB family protein [Microbacterium trichothecenolyticum]|uniref:GrpB family protein n=1 Tax=Microbacterium trichothecenolyticum TaxID=69370 RepID=UPI001C6F5195|nr:GrpB family protein [Microbacterium trichothecenolyticum]MBW9121653.1 GrpB family protein [Microbacterium trichothecenolyticum]
MAVVVVPYSDAWPGQFERVATDLRRALEGVPVLAIEHVGSTSVPGLAAKPVIDIDVVVERAHVEGAIAALVAAGYTHRGDLGVTDRESMAAPDDAPRRNVYVCVEGTLHLRNHLAVRAILRERADLRDRYGAVKTEIARDPGMSIETYLALKSPVLQEVLALSDLTEAEKLSILALNTGF